MRHNLRQYIDDETEDREYRKHKAAVTAAKYDFEHWTATGELRLLELKKDADTSTI